MTDNTRVLLKRRCEGVPVAGDFEVTSAVVESPADGQLLCETIYLSLDPYLRGRISGRHISGSVQPGELMPGEAISRVTTSRHPDYVPGELVAAHSGWQSQPVIDAASARRIDPGIGPLSTSLGILGMPGLTAYAGLLRLGEPVAGDTVLVSAASGAVGSLVGQIAKIKGCRVVGIAGAPEKCAWVTHVAGFDDVVSYKSGDLREALDRACPDGIDVYFDNVGGATLDTVLSLINLHARTAICGMISEYNLTAPELAPRVTRALLVNRARMQGLLVHDWADRRAEGIAQMASWIKAGELVYKEDVIDGIENMPAAFLRLLRGENFGKQLIKAGDPA